MRKLYTGGGEGIAQSRVGASHGLAGTCCRDWAVRSTLIRKTSIDVAMKSAPTVAMTFQNHQPLSQL